MEKNLHNFFFLLLSFFLFFVILSVLFLIDKWSTNSRSFELKQWLRYLLLWNSLCVFSFYLYTSTIPELIFGSILFQLRNYFVLILFSYVCSLYVYIVFIYKNQRVDSFYIFYHLLTFDLTWILKYGKYGA